MSIADDYRQIVSRLRSWGFTIYETSGCYSRSNGLNWARGAPVGHGNHHYVCSMNPSQAYINSLVNGLMDNKTVNWFADVNGAGYLVGIGPMNHFGQGNSSVLNRTLAGLPPLGPATAAGDMTGNTWYSGTETQHPGDSTPYPQPLIDVTVAISAAEAIQFGWSKDAAEVIEHFDWTGRKIDMSAFGGRNNGAQASAHMRSLVANRMKGTTQPPTGDWFDMATQADLDAAIAKAIPAIAKSVTDEVWARVLNTPGYVVATPGIDDRAGDLLAAAVRANEAAYKVWSKELDTYVPGVTGDASRAGNLLAAIHANTYPKA